MPVFAPKSEKIVFKKNSGRNKCTQNEGKCTISLEDFKNFPEVTPPTPSRAGRKCPAYSGLRPSKGLRFCWTPLSKVAGSAPEYILKYLKIDINFFFFLLSLHFALLVKTGIKQLLIIY